MDPVKGGRPEFRRAVETTDKWLEECIACHRNDPPLTEAEGKEAEEAVARCFALLDEKFKDENARLVNPVHVQRLVALEGKT